MAKKVFIYFILALFVIGNMALGETLPPLGYKKQLNPKDNPLAYKYFADYAMRMYQNFDAQKFGKRKRCTGYDFYLDGKANISKMAPLFYDSKRYNEYGKSFILRNTFPYYPNGLDIKNVKVNLGLCQTNFDRVDVDYFRHNNTMFMSVFKNYYGKKVTLTQKKYGWWDTE